MVAVVPIAIVAGAVVATATVMRLRARRDVRVHATRNDWIHVERDDDLASTWSLPPFVRLRSPSTAAEYRPTIEIHDVSRFGLQGALALAFEAVVAMTDGGDTTRVSYQVVAIRTYQGLPRTMVRRGPDVYELPSYEGLGRVREPRIAARNGVLSVVSEDPDAVRHLGLREIADYADAWGLGRATLVADGDWIYVFVDGGQRARRIEPMLDAVARLARAVPGKQWPVPGETHTSVYGAV